MPSLFDVSYGALWALVLFQTLVILGLTRAYQSASAATPAVPDDAGTDLQGQPVPPFAVTDLDGRAVTEADVAGSALLFVSPDCQTCSVTLAELEGLMTKTRNRVLLVCRSSDERCRQLLQTYGLDVPLVADPDLAFSRLFRVAAAPTAVLVGEDGQIDSYGQPMSTEEFEKILAGGRGPTLEVVMNRGNAPANGRDV